MAYDLQGRLVIGIASSALFDLAESDHLFRVDGEAAYRRFQEDHIDDCLDPGVAFPFIKRLLSLNDLSPIDDPLVEVIVLSRNSPETGLRVMRSIHTHSLPITRAIFMEGRSSYAFMPALNMSLFLSANEQDVRAAVAEGLPAGQVLESSYIEDDGSDLRIAFDFDGVLASDQAERVYAESGLDSFQQHEVTNASIPLEPGPLRDFLANVNKIQQKERERQQQDAAYRLRVYVSIVTARNAPAHERALASLKAWGVTVNDAFFLGGVEKGSIMEILRPHIFFDDQALHLRTTANFAPSVHVPFGAGNTPTTITEPTTGSWP